MFNVVAGHCSIVELVRGNKRAKYNTRSRGVSSVAPRRFDREKIFGSCAH